MKKIINILLAFVCVAGLSACSGSKVEDNAIKDYQSMMKKTQSVASGHIDGKLLFKIEKEDMLAKLSFNGDFIAQAKPQLVFELSAAANGIRMDNLAKAYMKDNIIYVNVLEQQKMAIPFDEKLLGSSKDTKQSIDKDAVKKSFKTFTVTKDGDKSVIKGEFSDAMLIGMKDQVKTSYSEGVSVKNITSAEIELTSNKDNFLENVRMKMNVTYHIDEATSKDAKSQDIAMDIEVIFNISKHNDVKSITFPDFKGYKKTTDLSKGSKDLLGQIEGNSL